MSDAFSRAATALHADSNIGSAATYTPAATRVGLAAVSARAIISQPTEAISGFGGPGLDASKRVASILVSALPFAPIHGDSITVGADTWLVASVEKDVEATAYTLTLAST